MTKKFLLGLALFLTAFSASSQTPTPIAPQVLGCTNPAPATSGQATVFFSACKTPAFLPLTTTSVIASVSKTSPSWAHSLSGYLPTDKVVACPAGATVSGATCTFNGADASALIAVNQVNAFTVVEPPIITGSVTWTAPALNTDGTPLTDLTSFNIYENAKLLGSVPSNVLIYSLGTLVAGQTYTVGVSAVNSQGAESNQATVTQTIPAPTPKVPGAPANATLTVK